MSTGYEALTYNPAAVSNRTRFITMNIPFLPVSNVTNYVSATNVCGVPVVADPVTLGQALISMIAPGTMQLVPIGSGLGPIGKLDSHKIQPLVNALKK